MTGAGGTTVGVLHGTLQIGTPGPPAMESIPPTPTLHKIPTGSELFVGRTDELKRLDSAVTGSGRAVVIAVHGLGGVGKSALVGRFVHLHTHRYTLVWWITADSATAIDTGLADLAAALAPATADLPVERRTELGVRWLASHQDWLLVLDNLTTPTDATILLQRVQTGTIVITSRQATGWRGVETIPLNVLSAPEATELLTRIVRADWPEADLTAADRLCEEVGWLPLAVEQAAAYIAQTRITPTAYLELLTRYPARTFTVTAEGGDAQRTMARVWHVTLDHIADTPLAGDLLRRLAWYSPDDIPRTLITTGTDASEFDLLHALGRLAAYNMITLDSDSISVHRLVQAVTRTPDPHDPHRQSTDIAHARDTTTAALLAALAGTDHHLPAAWPVFRMVLPHARALLDHTDTDTDTEQLCTLGNQLGGYLNSQGDTTTAIALLTRATLSYQRLYGPDRPDTLILRNNLAFAYEAAGDLGQAIPLFQVTLADRQRVLGPGHPDTLTSRNNLASAYRSAGDLEQAIPLFQVTLADRQRVLGPEHPDTLISRNNLASAYRSAGDLEQAIPLFETTLADIERVLGPDHPNTLTSRNNLAFAYEAAGDLGQAIPLFQVTLADRQRVLGPEHRDTLISRNNLASAYRSAGDLEQAIPLLETTLADIERVLGPDHPNTLTSRNNLAGAYEAAGDLEQAIPLLETTLADIERVLGPDHPNTLTSRNNLAFAYEEAGDLQQAIPLYEATLAGTERTLGPEHRLARAIRSNLEIAKNRKD